VSSPIPPSGATLSNLLIDHAQAYAELVDTEIRTFRDVYGRQIRLNVAQFFLLSIGITLAGIAAMLATTTLYLPWFMITILIVIPTLPLLAALCCYMTLQKPSDTPFEILRSQIKMDISMLRTRYTP
jgi:hypothetical protein